MEIENDHKAREGVVSKYFLDKKDQQVETEQSQRRGDCRNTTYSQDKERDHFHYN